MKLKLLSTPSLRAINGLNAAGRSMDKLQTIMIAPLLMYSIFKQIMPELLKQIPILMFVYCTV